MRACVCIHDGPNKNTLALIHNDDEGKLGVCSTAAASALGDCFFIYFSFCTPHHVYNQSLRVGLPCPWPCLSKMLLWTQSPLTQYCHFMRFIHSPLFQLFIPPQTEHDFNLEKQTLVHEAKLAIQEEFAKKEKDNEIKERIARSAEIGECRVKKMKLRDELLQKLLTEAGAKCAVVARGANYPQLLQKLIVQGLIKIEENEVVVYCRGEDVATVQSILPGAIKEYVEIMKRESGVTLQPKVTLNSDRSKDVPDSSYGGVMLTARGGKIVCDNTMASRLNLVYEELLPSIRAILFPEK